MSFPGFTLVLEDDVAVDPRKYGKLAAEALGITALEGKIAVRKGRGIFLENLPEEHARRIAAALEADAIRVRVVPDADLPEFPALRKVASLEHGEELLSYALPGGEREAVPWEAVLVAHVAVVAGPAYAETFSHVPFKMIPPIHRLDGPERDLIRENLILKMETPPPDNRLKNRRRPESIFEEIDQKFGRKVKVVADLVTQDLGLWLRVPLDELAYAYLEGGVRLGGPWGFQMLVNDLRQKCAAALTESALKLLEASDIREHVFLQVEECNRYVRWTALKRTLWPTADSSSPSPAPPEPPTDGGSSSASPEPAPPSTSS